MSLFAHQAQAKEEALQTASFQNSRLKSDFRVTLQEKEALKQEVMSLHKQLQNANDKVMLPKCYC